MMNTLLSSHNFLTENQGIQDVATRRSLATSLETKAEILGLLANDEDFYVRRAVAQHPNTTISALAQLSHDTEAQIRFFVAINPNTTTEFLNKLALDKYGEIRAQVAKSPNIMIELLEELAEDDYSETQYQVANNPSTPSYVLEKLAKKYLELAQSQQLWSCQAAVLSAIAQNENTPVAILDQICSINNIDNQYWLLSLDVAKNPKAPTYLLQQLADHEDIDVRRAVARNVNTPQFVIDSLTKDLEKSRCR
jgi:3-methyladenine DNA glycosylase AlkC